LYIRQDILTNMNDATLSITPWGNSHGIRLSRDLMQSMGITPDTPLEAHVIAKGRLELRAKTTKLTLAQKLKAYDPALHGGELMADSAVGAEFGAKP
jgi:antitoxin MazE